MILAIFSIYKPILNFISDHFISFKQKIWNHIVKIQSLTIKESVPFQIQANFFSLSQLFFFLLT